MARFELHSAQWIQFEDANGPGNAQPDHILASKETLWIFENKLTYTEEGWFQLEDLYSPICRELWEQPQVLVLVCKNLGEDGARLGKQSGGILDDLEELLTVRAFDADAQNPPRFLLHWLGINDA